MTYMKQYIFKCCIMFYDVTPSTCTKGVLRSRETGRVGVIKVKVRFELTIKRWIGKSINCVMDKDWPCGSQIRDHLFMSKVTVLV